MNSRHHVRVLLVEDNPGDVALVRKRLDDGFAIKAVHTLADALLDLASGAFDVVLLDLNLPDSEGLDTLLAIRGADETVPVVVVTGAAVDTVGGEALLAGAPEFVDKNELDTAALRRILRQAVERRHMQAHIYHTVWEQADPTVVLDLEGAILSANPGAAKLFGRSARDLVGMRLQVPADPGLSELTLARQGDEALRAEVRTSFTTWDGRPALLAAIRDITPQLRAAELEISKRESEGRLQLLMELLPVALWTTDDAFAVQSVIGSALGNESLDGRPMHDLFPGCGDVLSDAMTLASMAGEARFEARRSQRVFEGLIRRAGPMRGYLGMVFDVTDRRRLESQLRQSQKMEAVGRLAGGVAHDFNNMLTAIFSFASFVEEAMAPDDPALADIREVIQAAERARELTRQMLTFSRSHATRPEVLDVNVAIRDIERMLGRTLGDDVDLRIVLTDQPWRSRIDPGRLHQVVVNLCVNARDAMPGGGTIVIDTSNVTLDESYTMEHPELRPGDYVQIAVSDNGTGMTEEVAAQAFDPFFTTKEPGQGTGLGLSTCYGIVAQAGGAIVVYTEAGFGTSMKVYLPRIDEVPRLAVTARQPAPAGGAETVLVVEDNDQVLRLVVRALKNRGYHVLSVPNGAEALRMFERRGGEVDLVLTDVVMPGMSGQQLAERLAPTYPDVKLLFMSGYTRPSLHGPGIADGIDLVQKPFTPASLARQVRAALDADGSRLRDVLHS